MVAAYLVTGAVIPAAAQSSASRAYTLAAITTNASDVLAVNDRGTVLVERQFETGASPLPILLRPNGRETLPIQCPGTVNDTTGEAVNNAGAVVGHCGHDASAPGLFAFVAQPATGHLALLAVPGAQTTWGYGLNDDGQVVGFYANKPPGGCCNLPLTWLHGFTYDPETDDYVQFDHPLASAVGGWTWLQGINNRGQIVGHYNTVRNLPWEQYAFLYDHGVFADIAVPGANQTHITGLNDHGEVLGWSDACDQSLCPFLYEHGMYTAIVLPLPPNAPRPDHLPAGNARLSRIAGLNEAGEFVGTYIQTTAWGPDIFGNIGPSQQFVQHFIATPARHDRRR